MSKKWLISAFDLTGNASRPYRENGWIVDQIDIQLDGEDFYDYNYKLKYGTISPDVVGIIAMVPCTDYALSGARHFAKKDLFGGQTTESQRLVRSVKGMIDWFKSTGKLQFWQVENPMTRIHKLNPWLGQPKQKFNPCDFAGYDPNPDDSRYNKATWLFGEFKQMTPKRMEPLQKDNPGWKNYGGKSQTTKNGRSITPLGFAYAFYEANH